MKKIVFVTYYNLFILYSYQIQQKILVTPFGHDTSLNNLYLSIIFSYYFEQHCSSSLIFSIERKLISKFLYFNYM